MQIQIRVWDRIENKMIYDAEKSIDLCSYINNDRYDVMLNTNKNDASDQPIYCGDIVSSANYLVPDFLYVAWNDGCSGFCLRDEKDRSYAFNTSFALTIVGNIYEGIKGDIK